MKVNELTKLFYDECMKLLSDSNFTICKDKPTDDPTWKDCNFKLGITEEHVSRYGKYNMIQILAGSVINCIYSLHESCKDNFDVYIEEDPKIEYDCRTNIYKATCKFKSRISGMLPVS